MKVPYRNVGNSKRAPKGKLGHVHLQNVNTTHTIKKLDPFIVLISIKSFGKIWKTLKQSLNLP